MVKIALFGLSTLETLGLKSLMPEIRDLEIICCPVERLMGNEPVQADGFIVSADVFAAYSSFFIPRRQKTLLVTHGNLAGDGRELQLGFFDDEEKAATVIEEFIAGIDSGSGPYGELSEREKEVLRMIAEGKTNKMIAEKLYISVNTVITHRKNISSKTGIKSISGLSLYAVMNGIV